MFSVPLRCRFALALVPVRHRASWGPLFETPTSRFQTLPIRPDPNYAHLPPAALASALALMHSRNLNGIECAPKFAERMCTPAFQYGPLTARKSATRTPRTLAAFDTTRQRQPHPGTILSRDLRLLLCVAPDLPLLRRGRGPRTLRLDPHGLRPLAPTPGRSMSHALIPVTNVPGGVAAKAPDSHHSSTPQCFSTLDIWRCRRSASPCRGAGQFE